MLNKRQIPQNVIDVVEKAITRCVQDRIDNDPDVADAYLRITLVNNKFTVQAMYLEESLATAPAPNNDIALLNLMIDLNDCMGDEHWVVDDDAIHKLAESFLEVINIDIYPN